MISCECGRVQFKGSMPMVRAELSVMIHALYYDVLIERNGMTPEEAKKLILETVEKGFETEEQAKGNALDTFCSLLDLLKDKLNRKGDK